VSAATVQATFPRLGVPRSSASPSFAACASVALGGIGGSFGSTTASITTGPGVANAVRSMSPQTAGSSIV
jgi:hypothetical protein